MVNCSILGRSKSQMLTLAGERKHDKKEHCNVCLFPWSRNLTDSPSWFHLLEELPRLLLTLSSNHQLVLVIELLRFPFKLHHKRVHSLNDISTSILVN